MRRIISVNEMCGDDRRIGNARATFVLVISLAGTLVVDTPNLGAGQPARRKAQTPRQAEATSVTSELRELYAKCQTETAAGHYTEALQFYDRISEILIRSFPKRLRPNGHPEIAASYNIPATINILRGDYDQAEAWFNRQLAMRRRLYPPSRFPQGYDLVADSLHGLGLASGHKLDYRKALQSFGEAAKIYDRLYPPALFPRGHKQQAENLLAIGSALERSGKLPEALHYHRRALAMMERLFPADEFPQGSAETAQCLASMGLLLIGMNDREQALNYLRRSLAAFERLYPPAQYPDGHENLATVLGNLGYLLKEMGRFPEALTCYRRALTMAENLYLPERFPQGHPHTASLFTNLGILLEDMGDPGQALAYHRRALSIVEHLYPPERFPRGHESLVAALVNMGFLLREAGELKASRGYLERALDLAERLYPRAEYPQGHPQLADCLFNMGQLFEHLEQTDQALSHLRRSLAMYEQLYPVARYPKGHPKIIANTGEVATNLGLKDPELGAQMSVRALTMAERYYSPAQYPRGHPSLVKALGRAGSGLYALGRVQEAIPLLARAEEMDFQLSERIIVATSETEALYHNASHWLRVDTLIAAYSRLKDPPDDLLARLWKRQGVVFESARLRQRALFEASDPDVQALGRELATVRRRLGTLLVAPVGPKQETRAALHALGDRKEQLERELAASLPELGGTAAANRSTLADLEDRIPRGQALVIIQIYTDVPTMPERGKPAATLKAESRFVAFVVRPGQKTATVFLGPEAPIDAAIQHWLADIRYDRNGSSPEELRRLVWDKIEPHFPPDTRTVYLVPDAGLGFVPWTALPGKAPGGVLLEDYAVAVVPNGRFLLERLGDRNRPTVEPGRLLVLGGVDYGSPSGVEGPKNAGENDASGPLRGGNVVWPALDGTLREVEALQDLTAGIPTQSLTGREANVNRVLAELPGARWAHLATHGLFIDGKLGTSLQIDGPLFSAKVAGVGTIRSAPGIRNPLALSGLVLAGANLPVSRDQRGVPEGDGGILTAESIAALDLRNVDLVVLSACDTGVGMVAGGEGILGLQRGFHIAGARNVVASLWNVDDQATAVLMKLFFQKLWHEGKPAIEALREAQLTLYRHPEKITALMAARAPEFTKQSKIVEQLAREAKPPAHARTRLWAGFVLSGTGRP